MAKLSANEINTLKAIIEGGAGEKLYNRLQWNKAKTIRLSTEEKDLMQWHLTESTALTNDEKILLNKLIK